jgi:aminopeptidase YwaD
MKGGIHMDMVGGIPQTTKSVFFLSRPPASIPSFIGDVGEVFFDYVAEGSRRAAGQGDFSEAIVSPEGTKEDFVAEIQGLDLGSDHQVYGDSTFGIPMLYFHDWPDIYIHTNKDVPENMDATKLQRVAFLGAATGYTLASLGPDDGPALFAETAGRAARRLGTDRMRALALMAEADSSNLDSAYRDALLIVGHGLERESAALDSIVAFTGTSESPAPWIQSLSSIEDGDRIAIRSAYDAMQRKYGLAPRAGEPEAPSTPGAARVPERTEAVPGPTFVYYYDLLEDKLGHGAADAIDLPETVQFEVLNFVDGKRTVQTIRDAVSAELGPTDLEVVTAYLEILERAGAIRFK